MEVKMTNGDRIRKMGNDEMSRFLVFGYINCPPDEEWCEKQKMCEKIAPAAMRETCSKCWLDWLDKEA